MPSTTFEARLRKRRFTEDQEDGVICRWRHPGGLILDAMPSEPGILGFDNRWQGAAIPHAIERELPSGATTRAISPPYREPMRSSCRACGRCWPTDSRRASAGR